MSTVPASNAFFLWPSPFAVGDWVVATSDRLEAVLARWSSLERQDPDSGKAQVLATNVDLVLVTVPADRPNAARTERELTLAWDSGARPVVVLTKTDLGDEGLAGELASRLVGADLVATSAETGAGVDQLATLLAPGRTAVLLGPSGAGKSTLTNALVGEHRQATAAVRAEDRRGRHTTSSRQLFALDGGGVIIDTPGLRSLGLMSAEGIGEVFPDVDEYASDCRFRDCQHRDEPGCAVTAAVAGGKLAAERLASYRKLAREAAAEQRRVDPLAGVRRSACGSNGPKTLVGKARVVDFARRSRRAPARVGQLLVSDPGAPIDGAQNVPYGAGLPCLSATDPRALTGRCAARWTLRSARTRTQMRSTASRHDVRPPETCLCCRGSR